MTGIAELLSGPAGTVLADSLRVIHLAAVAIGFGAVVLNDFTFLRRMDQRIGRVGLSNMEAVHRLIMGAITIAWLSGAPLMMLTYGLDPSGFPPVLWGKLIVISLLTFAAVANRAVVLPVVRAAEGYVILHLPLAVKLPVVGTGALSVASWNAALILGATEAVQGAPGHLLAVVLGGFYLGVIGLTLWHTTRRHAQFFANAQRPKRASSKL